MRYKHVYAYRTCLADNFVHMFLSWFFHERHNLDLFDFKSQDFYDNYFSPKKKWFCTVLLIIASIISRMYLKKWSKVYSIIRQSSCFFVKTFIYVQQLYKKLLIKWCSSNNVNCCSFSFVQKPLMIRNNK